VPSSRRVFTDQSVDGLAEQVGVPGVPAILLDQVAEQPAQAGMASVGPGDVDELVEAAVGQDRVEPRCSSVRGPRRAAVTPGCAIANAIARWVSGRPASSATGISCSTASMRRSSRRWVKYWPSAALRDGGLSAATLECGIPELLDGRIDQLLVPR